MKSNRTKVLLVTLAVIVVVAAVAVSQTTRRGHWHRGGMFGPRAVAFLTHYLDLNDAQQARVKDILAQEKPTFKPLLQQLAQAHHQLRQYEESGNFDEAQVRLIASQQAQTLTELIVQKSRVEAELVQVLNPDQRAKLSQFIDKREARWQKHLANPAEPAQKSE